MIAAIVFIGLSLSAVAVLASLGGVKVRKP